MLINIRRQSAPKVRSAILRALIYFDLFDYPPTTAEIHRYLEVSASLGDVLRSLAGLADFISSRRGRWSLFSREEIFAVQERRAAASRSLRMKMRRILSLTRMIPFLRFVGLSGSLSMNNADNDGDTDIFFVTEPGKTRLAYLFLRTLSHVCGRRYVLCANFGLGLDRLALERRDLYAAHEIVQLEPCWGGLVYSKFLEKNDWAKRILPNAGPAWTRHYPYSPHGPLLIGIQRFMEFFLRGRFNPLAFLLESSYGLILRIRFNNCPDEDCFRKETGLMCGGYHYERRIMSEFHRRLPLALPNTGVINGFNTI